MVVITMALGLIIVCYLVVKAGTNTEPDQSEDQEAAQKKGAIKHQGWQTLDWTEPWNKK